MALLTVQKVVLGGLNPTYAACDVGGDEVVNSGFIFLHVKNGHTSSQSVAVDSVAACNQGFDHNVSVDIPNAEERMIGPFPRGRFNDPNAKIQITYPGGVTALTIAAIEVK